jgi:hypothetical protein
VLTIIDKIVNKKNGIWTKALNCCIGNSRWFGLLFRVPYVATYTEPRQEHWTRNGEGCHGEGILRLPTCQGGLLRELLSIFRKMGKLSNARPTMAHNCFAPSRPNNAELGFWIMWAACRTTTVSRAERATTSLADVVQEQVISILFLRYYIQHLSNVVQQFQ